MIVVIISNIIIKIVVFRLLVFFADLKVVVICVESLFLIFGGFGLVFLDNIVFKWLLVVKKVLLYLFLFLIGIWIVLLIKFWVILLGISFLIVLFIWIVLLLVRVFKIIKVWLVFVFGVGNYLLNNFLVKLLVVLL